MRLSAFDPDSGESLDQIRVSQLAERHERVVEALQNLIGSDDASGDDGPSTWVQYDLSLGTQTYEAEAGAVRSCDEAVAASAELSAYFARLFEVAARQVNASSEKAVLNDLAQLEEAVGREASWARQQNADMAGG
ncbi:MAG: hypothetical protein AAF266_01120 [Planctomycetota bacterium]